MVSKFYDFNDLRLWVKTENDKIVEISFSPIKNAIAGFQDDLIYKELRDYFNGDLKEFTVKLDPHGTSFQKQVWSELLKVKYGETSSYSDIASNINNPKALRAVGTAIGRNPIAIIIPCHRIINKDGRLGGYSAGLNVKKMLMRIENNG